MSQDSGFRKISWFFEAKLASGNWSELGNITTPVRFTSLDLPQLETILRTVPWLELKPSFEYYCQKSSAVLIGYLASISYNKGMGFPGYKNMYLVITNTYINADILGRTASISARDTARKYSNSKMDLS